MYPPGKWKHPTAVARRRLGAVREAPYRGAFYLTTECRRLCKAALAGFPIKPPSTKPMAVEARG